MTTEKTITGILESQGWHRRFVAEEPRLTEAVEMYKELGFQVRVEPLPTQEKGQCDPAKEDETACRVCFSGATNRYGIIFTKSAESQNKTCSD